MFSTIEGLSRAYENGGMIIVVDDDSRENEGILSSGGHGDYGGDQFHGSQGARSGVRSSFERVRAPSPPGSMVREGTDKHGHGLLVSVDAKEGTTTGISADERAATS